MAYIRLTGAPVSLPTELPEAIPSSGIVISNCPSPAGTIDEQLGYAWSAPTLERLRRAGRHELEAQGVATDGEITIGHDAEELLRDVVVGVAKSTILDENRKAAGSGRLGCRNGTRAAPGLIPASIHGPFGTTRRRWGLRNVWDER